MTIREPVQAPYKTTPIFDEDMLPAAIRNANSTKAGVWGMLRVLEGRADLVFHDPARTLTVAPGQPGLIEPEAVHHVETDGPVRLEIAFFRARPDPDAATLPDS